MGGYRWYCCGGVNGLVSGGGVVDGGCVVGEFCCGWLVFCVGFRCVGVYGEVWGHVVAVRGA